MAAKHKSAPKNLDPAVDELAGLIHASGMSDEAIAQRVGAARAHGMSPATVRALRECQTTRPHNYTITWVGFALGLRRVWQRIGD